MITGFFLSLVLFISLWVSVTPLGNFKCMHHLCSKRLTKQGISSLSMTTHSSSYIRQYLKPFLTPFVGVSLSLLSAMNVQAATFIDPYFQVSYPDSFVESPKPLKTHEREFLVKSEGTKGYNFGVTMDRVKIADIRDFFKEPAALANKLVEVEKSKEGVFEVNVLQAVQSTVPLVSPSTTVEPSSAPPVTSTEEVQKELPSTATATAYTIEYKVDSSRGQNHYLVKATVVSRRLLVATVQTRDEDFSGLSVEANRMLESLSVSTPQSTSTPAK